MGALLQSNDNDRRGRQPVARAKNTLDAEEEPDRRAVARRQLFPKVQSPFNPSVLFILVLFFTSDKVDNASDVLENNLLRKERGITGERNDSFVLLRRRVGLDN